ncbi:MAG TPA: hemopexin repeat-containing protein, partial [Gemmatimonadales bacterium]|nr:hemopexin repeat-containing protein [Gemmatimonadales bacterium]
MMSLNETLTGWNSWKTGPLRSGPMVGEVHETEASIWAQAGSLSPLSLTVKGPNNFTTTFVKTPLASDGLCVLFHVTGLTSGVQYTYTVTNGSSTTPAYKLTAGLPATARKIRVAFGSCFHDYWKSPADQPIFSSIAAENVDLFVMAGDNCYMKGQPSDPPMLPASGTDYQDETAMMLCHLRHRNSDALRTVIPNVSTVGLWDDHDFGTDNASSTFPNKASSRSAFKRMWAQSNYGDGTSGIYSKVRCGPVEVFLIDDRYWRTSPEATPPRILGDQQLAWLKAGLSSSTAQVKLIVSGSVVLPAFIHSSALENVDEHTYSEWEGWRRNAPSERDQLFDYIAEHDIRGVLFLSGDLHLGFLYHRPGSVLPNNRRGPDFWEVISSSLANSPWKVQVLHGDSPIYDPGVYQEVVTTNYGVINVDLDRSGEEIKVALKDEQGKARFLESIPLASLAVRPDVQPLSVVGWPGQHAYFFKAGHYLRYTTGTTGSTQHPDAGYPKPIQGNWPEVSAVDTGLVMQNGKAYLFTGNGYVRYSGDPLDPGANASHYTPDPGYPNYISRAWTGFWSRDLDAAVVWTNGEMYFFKDKEYIRCAPNAHQADAGYPRPILGNWPGLGEAFPDGIDGAVVWSSEKA